MRASFGGAHNEIPLVAGSIKGIRQWTVDPQTGFLGAISASVLWRNGENESVCINQIHGARMHISGFIDPRNAKRYDRPYNSFSSYARSSMDEHDFDGNCACGFYAYYDPDSLGGNYNMLAGVMEGYGRVVIGSRGFRASKAKIRALYIPNYVPEDDPDPVQKSSALSKLDKLWAHTRGVVFAALAVVLLSLLFVAVPLRAMLTTIVFISLVTVLFSLVALIVGIPLGSKQKELPTWVDGASGQFDQNTIKRIRENYPDVQIFNDWKKMLKAFPLDKEPR